LIKPTVIPMPKPLPTTVHPSPIDFDLHGIVGVRLVDANARDVAVVVHQLGPIQTTLDRAPDITIRFVDRLSTRSLRYIGLDAAFSDDAFMVLRSKQKTKARILLPMKDLGRPCEIVCEHGLAAVPLLLAIVNLTCLAKNVLPLHASTFQHEGTGVLVTGWAKGGKTETLLSFLAHGAEHVADEWTYLAEDSRVSGIPEPVRVWDWHLRELPDFWARVPRRDRARLRALRMAARVTDWLAAGRLGRAGFPRLSGRIANLLRRQQSVQVPPHRLFGDRVGSMVGALDLVVFAASHDSPEIIVKEMDSAEIAGRMAFSLQEERQELMRYYRSFRFAFPQAANDLLDSAAERESRLLAERLAGRRALALLHPYPVSIPAIFDALAPHLKNGPSRSGNGTGRHKESPAHPDGAVTAENGSSRRKILVASSICPEALAELGRDHDVVCAFGADEETLRRKIADREILVFRSGVNISAEVMACAPGLKLLLRAGSGLDNLNLPYVEEHGIELLRIPEPGAQAVAELTFALMLVVSRHVLTGDQLLRRGVWAKGDLTGWSLAGKVLGIVGAGSIGSRVGHLGAAWGMKVLGCIQHPSPARAAIMAGKGIRLTGLEEVLAAADYLTIHVPKTPATRGLIGAEALARMKPGAFLINVARGGIVDEAALRQALVDGKLRGAGLDVHAAEGAGKISPLADLPNVVLTPHIGASTIDAQRQIGKRVIEAVAEFARRPASIQSKTLATSRREPAGAAAGMS